jgi:hypothetical protein
MLRTLDNLTVQQGTGGQVPRPTTELPMQVFRNGVDTMSTAGTTYAGMIGTVMSAMSNMGDFPNLSETGYGNAPQTYIADAALNRGTYACEFNGTGVLPIPGTLVFAMQDTKAERTARTKFASRQSAHAVQYPSQLTGAMNEKPHPMSTPEGLNYYLLTRQLDRYMNARGEGGNPNMETLSPDSIADLFSLDGICVSNMIIGKNATLTNTYQGRANCVNNFGVNQLAKGSKIYVIFKRCPKRHIPERFFTAPYQSPAERENVMKLTSKKLEEVGDEFTPVLAYPVVLASGGRITAEHLMDEMGNVDNAIFYLGKVFSFEDYQDMHHSSYGQSTDVASMRPFSDAGDGNTRGILEIVVDPRRV